MITGVYIGTSRLELFEDEEIKIKSKVSDIRDITKVFTDTSNDFTVPASDVNNAIFKHWYESDVVNGFDARRKVPATIEMHGTNYKVGKIKLNKVNFKHNQPDNYSIEFFGNLVELKDLLANDLLNTLDLSALNFSYSTTNLKAKLQAVGDVSFSLLSKRRLLYDSSSTTIDNDTQTNVYYDADNDNTGIQSRDLFGSVKQIKIIEAIESKYNLTFSRDFLGAYDFSNQFLCLSNTKETTTPNIIAITNLVSAEPDPTKSGNVLLATGLGTDEERETFDISLTVNIDSGSVGKEYSIYIKNNGVIIARRDGLTNSASIQILQTELDEAFNEVTFFIETSEVVNYNATLLRGKRRVGTEYEYTSGASVSSSTYNVSQKLPNIKVIDYLSGLFKFSKLVAIPQKDGTVYIDNLTSYLSKGKVYDLTKYLDVSSYQVSMGKLLNRINYEFSDPKTILNNKFKEINGIGYGDLKLDILDEDGKLIEGTSLEFKLPFEQIIYEKILDTNSSTLDTNIQYGLLLDKDLKSLEIKPHIHYIESRTTSIKFINSDGSASDLKSANIPLHVLTLDSQLYSSVFGNEFNSFNGSIISNTLYSNYHKEFIENVFNVNKREYNFKAIEVPLDIVLNIQLNDVIEINKKYHRIESLETNTSNNNIDFKLINDRNVNLI